MADFLEKTYGKILAASYISLITGMMIGGEIAYSVVVKQQIFKKNAKDSTSNIVPLKDSAVSTEANITSNSYDSLLPQ